MCCANFHNMSWLLVWILEEYGTDNLRLKHVVDTEELVGHINIKVGSELCDEKYRVITVHPEWNFIFLVRKDRTQIAYDMDCRKVHVIHACVIRYRRPSDLTISSLCSLILGVISRAVNVHLLYFIVTTCLCSGREFF